MLKKYLTLTASLLLCYCSANTQKQETDTNLYGNFEIYNDSNKNIIIILYNPKNNSKPFYTQYLKPNEHYKNQLEYFYSQTPQTSYLIMYLTNADISKNKNFIDQLDNGQGMAFKFNLTNYDKKNIYLEVKPKSVDNYIVAPQGAGSMHWTSPKTKGEKKHIIKNITSKEIQQAWSEGAEWLREKVNAELWTTNNPIVSKKFAHESTKDPKKGYIWSFYRYQTDKEMKTIKVQPNQ